MGYPLRSGAILEHGMEAESCLAELPKRGVCRARSDRFRLTLGANRHITTGNIVDRHELGEELLTGHPLIDHQHQTLLALIDGMAEAVESGANWSMLQPRLQLFLRLLEEHFRSEEQVMREQYYPDYAQHRAVHQQLLAQARQWNLSETEHAPALEELLNVLYEVVLRHVEEEDLPLAFFMRRQARC